MKTGKLSEAVLKRTVIKEISYKNSNVIEGSAPGCDAAVIAGKSEDICTAVSSFAGELVLSTKRAFAAAVNSVAAKGADPCALTVSFTLPETVKESELRRAMVWLNEAGRREGVQIAGGHTQTVGNLNWPVGGFDKSESECQKPAAQTRVSVVTVNVIGHMSGSASKTRVREGMSILMTGFAATEGTQVLIGRFGSELRERFSDFYVNNALRPDEELMSAKAAAVAVRHGGRAMHDISRGGVFGALWELGEYHKMGLCVDINSIPVRQETVEFCEYFDYNPYFVCSSGALLIVSDEPERLMEALAAAGVNAAVIGHMTQGRDKVIVNGDEKRFLEPNKSGKNEDYI